MDTSYIVSEDDGTLNISIRLTAGGIERAFPSTVEVEFSITDLTTEGEDATNYSLSSIKTVTINDMTSKPRKSTLYSKCLYFSHYRF